MAISQQAPIAFCKFLFQMKRTPVRLFPCRNLHFIRTVDSRNCGISWYRGSKLMTNFLSYSKRFNLWWWIKKVNAFGRWTNPQLLESTVTIFDNQYKNLNVLSKKDVKLHCTVERWVQLINLRSMSWVKSSKNLRSFTIFLARM